MSKRLYIDSGTHLQRKQEAEAEGEEKGVAKQHSHIELLTPPRCISNVLRPTRFLFLHFFSFLCFILFLSLFFFGSLRIDRITLSACLSVGLSIDLGRFGYISTDFIIEFRYFIDHCSGDGTF